MTLHICEEELGQSYRDTSIRTRIETTLSISFLTIFLICYRDTSIRTRIETGMQFQLFNLNGPVIEILPLEQGLKPNEYRINNCKNIEVIEILPLEQGLKHLCHWPLWESIISVIEILPLEQGLKHSSINFCGPNFSVIEILPLEQGRLNPLIMENIFVILSHSQFFNLCNKGFRLNFFITDSFIIIGW